MNKKLMVFLSQIKFFCRSYFSNNWFRIKILFIIFWFNCYFFLNFREIEILITHASTQHQAATCMTSISKTHETQISWYIGTCSQEMSCTPWQNKYRNINDKHRQYWIKTTQTIIKRAWTRTLRALSTKKMKSQMTSLKSSSVKSPMIPIITPKRMRARTRRSKVNL